MKKEKEYIVEFTQEEIDLLYTITGCIAGNNKYRSVFTNPKYGIPANNIVTMFKNFISSDLTYGHRNINGYDYGLYQIIHESTIYFNYH